MHNHVDHRWIKAFLKQLKLASRIYLSTAIVISPIFFINSANASTLAGGSGWRVASTVANGVGVTVNGVKDIMVNGAKKTMTGVANVTPTASQVGKFMGKNLGAAAVIGAMDLLLDGVDYVLDPANNSVTYKPKCSSNCQYMYQLQSRPDTRAHSPDQACQNGRSQKIFGDRYTTSVTYNSSKKICVVHYNFNGTTGETEISSFPVATVANPNYDQSKEEEKKTVPLSEIGQQVIDQAQSEAQVGNPAVPIATPVTQAAAAAVVGEAAKDESQARPIVAELDKSASIPTDQTDVGEIAPPTTNPDTGEAKPGSISLDFPVFCSWAPSMCVLADKVQEAITDATDWATTEPQQKDPENLEFEDLELDASDVNLTASGSCPQDSVSFSVMGKSVTLDMPYQPVCDALNFFKPAVLLVGAVASVYIVAGVRTKEEDQP
jgi:hypothetical protein